MFTRLPKATQVLLWINGGMLLLEYMIRSDAFDRLLLWPLGGIGQSDNPIAAVFGNFIPWQLVTYSFLHADVGHLFFNMLGLMMFGAPLEHMWGTKRFVIFYFVSVVGAGLTYLAWAALIGIKVPVLGASGGVFGLLLAYGMLFPKQRVMPFPGIEFDARNVAIAYGVIELLYGVTGMGGGNIAHFAHLGGMLFGWLVIRYWRGQPPFKRRRRPPPPPPPRMRIVR
jgi:membrane associated rhomboid family serine protease